MFINNILFIYDLFSSNGEFLYQKAIEDKIGTKLPFTVYFGLKMAIPNEWKLYMKSYKKKTKTWKDQPQLIGLQKKKGGQSLRRVWQIYRKRDQPIGQVRWAEKLELPLDINWKILYDMGEKCKLNIRSKFFQYQVLNRSIMTNRKLFQYNMKEDDKCENCGEIETISLLLYNCNTTKIIWESLKTWLQPLIREEVHIDEVSCILGNKNNTVLTNYIFIILKHEIYKFKWKKIPYRLMFLKRSLKINHLKNVH